MHTGQVGKRVMSGERNSLSDLLSVKIVVR